MTDCESTRPIDLENAENLFDPNDHRILRVPAAFLAKPTETDKKWKEALCCIHTQIASWPEGSKSMLTLNLEKPRVNDFYVQTSFAEVAQAAFNDICEGGKSDLSDEPWEPRGPADCLKAYQSKCVPSSLPLAGPKSIEKLVVQSQPSAEALGTVAAGALGTAAAEALGTAAADAQPSRTLVSQSPQLEVCSMDSMMGFLPSLDAEGKHKCMKLHHAAMGGAHGGANAEELRCPCYRAIPEPDAKKYFECKLSAEAEGSAYQVWEQCNQAQAVAPSDTAGDWASLAAGGGAGFAAGALLVAGFFKLAKGRPSVRSRKGARGPVGGPSAREPTCAMSI